MTKIKNGIILAGGTGSRLMPFSGFVSKSLLNVDGKPIIDYPINTLVQAGITNLTIVVGSSFSGQIMDYVGDGSRYGLVVNYCRQEKAEGIAHAINLCKRFVSDDNQFMVCLGDNVFEQPIDVSSGEKSAKIVVYPHAEINRFGAVFVDKKTQQIIKFEEKPKTLLFGTNAYAITGAYIFDNKYFDYFKNISKSARGEYEIVEIIQQYAEQNNLDLIYYPQDALWHDVGTHDSIAIVNDYFFQLKKNSSQNPTSQR